MGYLEMAMGLGLTVGPILSSVAYPLIGYSNTFYFFAIFIFVVGQSFAVCLPQRLDS
jgi:hypothetical protein